MKSRSQGERSFIPSIEHHAGALFGLQQREVAVLEEAFDAFGAELALRTKDGEVVFGRSRESGATHRSSRFISSGLYTRVRSMLFANSVNGPAPLLPVLG